VDLLFPRSTLGSRNSGLNTGVSPPWLKRATKAATDALYSMGSGGSSGPHARSTGSHDVRVAEERASSSTITFAPRGAPGS